MHPSSELQVVSVNVGLPRAIVWKGRTVVTGIFKEPVAGRVAIRRLNLEGDRQADLTVHGGAEKAGALAIAGLAILLRARCERWNIAQLLRQAAWVAVKGEGRGFSAACASTSPSEGTSSEP